MQIEVIMAGFGGQGLMLIGKMLAEAGMREGKEVTWLPSYGPEMRGGTANCTVVISDRPVGSPIVKSPRDLVAMNLPSLDKFEATVRPGGVVVVNASLIPRPCKRKDVHELRVPATEIANECGATKSANMVVFGAYVARTGVVKPASIEAQLREKFGAKKAALEANLRAFARGLELGAASGKEAR